MYGHTCSKSMDQPGKVANPSRGELNREMDIFLSAFAPENLVSRDGFDSPVPRQPAHLHTQPESDAYLRGSYRVPCMYVCMYVCSSHIARVWINRVRLPFLLVVS